MNLQKLKITNYKRLKDVELEIPSTGVIGIVGNNGAGKSTLFEAILWVLYGPKAGIGARNVTPRALGGNTEVALTVEQDETIYQVVRRARASGANPDALIYRNEEPEPFVRGVREVTRFVQASLLHMNVAAFTTTFFAKQKELEFFSGSSDADRRRQVQRLLDLDAIEMAHEALRDESREAQNTLHIATIALQQAGGDRDFDAELTEAQQKAAFARAALAELDAALAECNRQHAEAHTAHVALLDVKRRHDDLDKKRRDIAVILAREEANEDAARRTLAALAEREARAAVIAPDVARLPAVSATLHEAQAAAAHAQKIQRAAVAVRGAEETVAALGQQVDEIAHALDPLRDLLFTWEDVAEAAPGLARAHTLAHTLAATGPRLVESTAQQKTWDALARLADDRDRAAARAREAANAIAQIEARLNVVRAGGDPAEGVDRLTAEVGTLTEQNAARLGEITALRAELKRYTELLRRWEGSDADEPCPTCGRPFSEEDAGIILASLRRSIAVCTANGKAISAVAEQARDVIREHNVSLQADQKRLKEAETLTAQRTQSMRQEADAREKTTAAQDALAHALKEAGRRAMPNADDLQDLGDEIRLLTRGASAAGQAANLEGQIAKAEATATTRRDALLALGPDTYNAAAHADLQAEHERLIALGAEASGIAQQLAMRPESDARLAAARRAYADGEAETVRLRDEQEALGFDADALLDAATRVATLAAQRDEATAAHTDERFALHNAENAVAAIEKERGRIAILRTDAATHAATANRYRLMDTGFTDFSRDLAARIRPRLGDYASEQVERMTNGRYERVVFDDNYAPALYDGGDAQFFPLTASPAHFSGGERDVAALACRIAASQLLAERGSHRVGFMVLDEVFGSLDEERRTLVLDALASMRSFIPQLFIISHVNDVRLSPVMDEVWTVASLADGTSTVYRKGLSDVDLN